MANFASFATTCGAHKHAWTKKKKKVGENNGQLRFVRHHGWRKHAWTKRELNDGDSNGQATHGAHKHAWRTQATWAKIILNTKLMKTFPFSKCTKLNTEMLPSSFNLIFATFY